MEFLTKEKSKQKRKGVNNQNNSASYFRLCNTDLHHHSIKKSIKKRPIVVLRIGSTSGLYLNHHFYNILLLYLDDLHLLFFPLNMKL